MELDIYLQDIENRLNELEEEAVLSSWRKFSDGKYEDGPFTPAHRTPRLSGVKWPDININDAIEDEELMMLNQWVGGSNPIAGHTKNP